MKRIINFILQHFLVTAVVVTFSVVLYQTFSDPEFNLSESMQRNNINWFSGLGLIGFGLLFLLAFRLICFRKIPNKEHTMGVIVKTAHNHHFERFAYVKYYVNGVSYVITSKYSTSFFQTGNHVRVAYNKMNPTEAMVYPVSGIYLIIGVMIFFGILSIILDLFIL